MSIDKHHHGDVVEEREGAHRRASRMRASALIAVAVTGPLLLAAGRSDDGDDLVAEARSAVAKYVEVRELITREKRDWAFGRELLEDRIGVVQNEIAELREQQGQVEGSIVELDRRRAELVDRSEVLKGVSSALSARVEGLERRLLALLERLPDPLRERARPLSQQIPSDSSETKLSTSARFQNVVGILNEIDKFNRDIVLTSELRELSDGSKAEVVAMYVGLGSAYFVSADGLSAGAGVPTDEGWRWSPADASAAEIERAIAILNNEQAADFAHLPFDPSSGGRR